MIMFPGPKHVEGVVGLGGVTSLHLLWVCLFFFILYGLSEINLMMKPRTFAQNVANSNRYTNLD